MKTKQLLLSFMVMAALLSACRKEPSSQGEAKALTVAEFLAEPESDRQVYELVGTIHEIFNSSYGLFNLKDETGMVYVDGLTASDPGYGGANDRSFASLSLKLGDLIRVRGYRSSFEGEVQLRSAWLVKNLSTGETPGGNTPGGNTPDTPSSVAAGSGTLADPYNPLGAVAAVKNLTWTSNDNFEKTKKVYVKGKISRISNNGTFVGGGAFGNASFYISADGKQADEFQVFRTLYFGGEKYTSGTDIKVGDEVVIYGVLMNYKGNTPMTVQNESHLYSLNGVTSSGGGTPSDASKVSFETTDSSGSWSARTDGTYGAGFVMEREDLRVGYYRHTGSTAMVAPNANHVRIYKNGVLCIESLTGQRMKKIVIGCAPNVGTTSYCSDMSGLEGGANARADASALTVTWNGSAPRVVLQSSNGQVRMEKLTVEFE